MQQLSVAAGFRSSLLPVLNELLGGTVLTLFRGFDEGMPFSAAAAARRFRCEPLAALGVDAAAGALFRLAARVAAVRLRVARVAGVLDVDKPAGTEATGGIEFSKSKQAALLKAACGAGGWSAANGDAMTRPLV